MRIENDVFTKIGKRYKPIGTLQYHAMPAEGVWLVKHTDGCKSESLIYRIGELPELDGATVAKLFTRKNEVAQAVSELMKQGQTVSTSDLVDAVFKAMGVVAAEMLEEEEKQ